MSITGQMSIGRAMKQFRKTSTHSRKSAQGHLRSIGEVDIAGFKVKKALRNR